MEPNKTTQIKISFFSSLPPFRGGISSFSKFLFTALKGKSAIEGFTFRRQYPSILFPGESQTDATSEDLYPRIVTSYNPFSFFGASRKMKRTNPDVFIANYWMSFFAPMYVFMAKSFSKKVFKVALIHNLIPHEPRFFDKAFNAMFLRNFDAFVVLSEKVKMDLLSFDPDAICKVIPHPTYNQFGAKKDKLESRVTLGIPQEAKVLLFFGLIRDYKGLDVLIESIRFLDDSYVLLIAGEIYGDKKKYTKQIESIENSLVVLHDRFISDDEVSNYFSAADCCVLPYKAGTQSGIQAVAASFQVPVLVSKNAGLHESIEEGKNGFVIDELEPEMLGKCIENVFSGGKLHIVEDHLLQSKDSQADEWSIFANEFMNFISEQKIKK